MAARQFEGGVIHVSAPHPTRSLRFNAPGQEIVSLLPRFRKLGFDVSLSFSNAPSRKTGFFISQNEINPKALSIVVNSAHKKFELEKLAVELPAPRN